MALGITQQPSGTMRTPVGNVLQAPNDAQTTTDAINRAIVGNNLTVLRNK